MEVKFRVFIVFLALSLCPILEAAELGPMVDTRGSPHAVLKTVPFDAVTLEEGFWHRWVEVVRQRTLPLLYKLAADPERGAIRNFEIAAGLRQGSYTGNNWMDGWVYKWLELLGGVVTLNGTARRLPKDDSALYTPLPDVPLQPLQIKLIPYYAWNNRGISR